MQKTRVQLLNDNKYLYLFFPAVIPVLSVSICATLSIILNPKIICMKLSRLLVACSLVIALVVVSCNQQNAGDGKIPFDQARAQQSVISIDTAKQYQANFIRTRDSLRKLPVDTSFPGENFNLPNAESFSRDALILLLNQTG